MDFDKDTIGRIATSPFAIGALGALVTAVKFTPGASWRERAFNVFSGALCAGFLTPAIVEWLNMKSPAYSSGAAFLFGLVGMSLAAALLQAIKDTPLGQIVTGWISRRS
ncbi:hypothetical protein [Caldimonas sp. KR1-144]|uniref:hypothetical protein n=1 Tax=Caldimonas sp. KR1-144 TaxID=3400911 RepID=UPI003BFF0247